jgi:hypothetical protein
MRSRPPRRAAPGLLAGPDRTPGGGVAIGTTVRTGRRCPPAVVIDRRRAQSALDEVGSRRLDDRGPGGEQRVAVVAVRAGTHPEPLLGVVHPPHLDAGVEVGSSERQRVLEHLGGPPAGAGGAVTAGSSIAPSAAVKERLDDHGTPPGWKCRRRGRNPCGYVCPACSEQEASTTPRGHLRICRSQRGGSDRCAPLGEATPDGHVERGPPSAEEQAGYRRIASPQITRV